MNTIDPEQREIIKNLIEKAAVKIFLKKEDSKWTILANAQLLLGGLIEISGFTIRESDFGGLWIQPPKYGQYSKSKSFFIKDNTIWKIVEEKIERAYKNKLDEEELSESIENIPF